MRLRRAEAPDERRRTSRRRPCPPSAAGGAGGGGAVCGPRGRGRALGRDEESRRSTRPNAHLNQKLGQDPRRLLFTYPHFPLPTRRPPALWTPADRSPGGRGPLPTDSDGGAPTLRPQSPFPLVSGLLEGG